MTLTDENKLARYDLLCRALQAQPAAHDPVLVLDQPLNELRQIITQQLPALASKASPVDFAELYLEFRQEFQRFKEFVAFPKLATKTIVAFGGSFSAGKSSLINALLGEALMVAEVDPTTALPAYVLAGETNAIYALNQHGLRIPLTEDEFASLTHDEKMLYGSQVARALSTAFVEAADFNWQNLAFIDTPGYSGQTQAGDRTDAKIAVTQINSAHALVWVVSAKQGVIPESDLDFLAQINSNIPLLVVVTRADQINADDLASIVTRISTTLAERNLPTLGVFPASAHPKHRALLEPIKAQLNTWNTNPQQQTFTQRFKSLFVRYQRSLEADRHTIQWRENRLQQLQLLADAEVLQQVEELAQEATEKKQALENVIEEMAALRQSLFKALKQTGALVGIDLPEPHEMDLLPDISSNLLQLLTSLREEKQQPAPDLYQTLSLFRQATTAKHSLLIIRRKQIDLAPALAALQLETQAANKTTLLRLNRSQESLLFLQQEAEVNNQLFLLRNPQTNYQQALLALT